MNKLNVSELFNTVRKGIVKHSPEILTAIGIAGTVTTTVLAVKATPKAMKLVEEAENEKTDNGCCETLTKMEIVKVAWKPYIPAVITGVASVGCLIGASNVNIRRNAALATAYQISTTALNEYKDKVVETIGEDKAKEIKDKIIDEKKEKVEATKATYIITNDDDIIFYEPVSNREFKSTVNKIEKAMNEANKRMISGMEMHMTFNEWLDELNLPHSPIGDDIGWTANDCIDITFEDGRTENNKPCFIISYLQPPFHDFEDRY